MFGPNIPGVISENISYHHREKHFFDIYSDVIMTFKSIFEIQDDYEVVIVNGSGTLAIETFIFSYKEHLNLLGTAGDFKKRWESLLCTYGKIDMESQNNFYCQYETSRSTYQYYPNPTLLDCVSSFPYYEIPQGTKCWVTVSSKMLGAAPVLGIIVIRKDLINKLEDRSKYSTLNLANLLEYGKYNQTPQTPMIPLYLDLLRKLTSFKKEELKERINYRCQRLVSIIGKENIIGDLEGPVLTLSQDYHIPTTIEYDYAIYGSQSISKKTRQIFVYSESDKTFDEMIKRYQAAVS
jgi:aspartate aminotransferase-like enzyme